jgi:site-specific DNA-adenine methylase
MPKPELYVIYTGDRKGKPDVISLSEEFFGGADVDVEVKAKVIYESNTDDIINQYIIFCKVFDDQRKLYGLTEQTVRETIRICKDRNVLREYLESREKEVVTIMMSLFDEEQIMKVYIEDYGNQKEKEGIKEGERRTARDTAKRFLEMGKLSVEEIAAGTGLTVDEVKEIESGIRQLA